MTDRPTIFSAPSALSTILLQLLQYLIERIANFFGKGAYFVVGQSDICAFGETRIAELIQRLYGPRAKHAKARKHLKCSFEFAKGTSANRGHPFNGACNAIELRDALDDLRRQPTNLWSYGSVDDPIRDCHCLRRNLTVADNLLASL